MRKRSKVIQFSFLLSAAAALVACGGSGSSGTTATTGTTTLGTKTPTSTAPTATVGAAQGVYSGSFAAKDFPNGKFDFLVLEDDSYYVLYGNRDDSGTLIVSGLVQGNGAALSDGTFSSPNLKTYASDGSVSSGTLAATYQSGATFNGTVTDNGSINFAGVAPTAGSTSYNYNTPAALSTITGGWSGRTLLGSAHPFTVSTEGELSGTTAYGCTFVGSVLPRTSGKSVFNATVTLVTSSRCGPRSGLTLRGVALTTLLPNGLRQLVIAFNSEDRTKGDVLFANRKNE